MLTRDDYIRMSLELDLFFLRIMKEHSFFLGAAFTAQNINLGQYAEYYARQFGALLAQTIVLANGALRPDTIQSGQYFTQYTKSAEQISQYYTGVPIDLSITPREESIQSGAGMGYPQGMAEQVSALNQNVLALLPPFIAFQNGLLSDVLTCKMFMNTYPLLIEHITREAVFFHNLLQRLQSGADIRTEQDLAEQEVFWNRIMAEHAKFIRGLLDPTENELFTTADRFGKEFDQLMAEAMRAQQNPAMLPTATAESLEAAKRISAFKAAGTGGLLMCKIRSMILPLLGDHVLREANHFVYLLEKGGETR